MFVAYEKALLVLRLIGPVVAVVKRHDGDLAKQITRAANSVVLNLSEGSGRVGQDRIHLYRIAQGSAREVMAGLRAIDAWGWTVDADAAIAELDQVLAILWRMTTPRGSGPR
jgi:four helix bundle protein